MAEEGQAPVGQDTEHEAAFQIGTDPGLMEDRLEGPGEVRRPNPGLNREGPDGPQDRTIDAHVVRGERKGVTDDAIGGRRRVSHELPGVEAR